MKNLSNIRLISKSPSVILCFFPGVSSQPVVCLYRKKYICKYMDFLPFFYSTEITPILCLLFSFFFFSPHILELLECMWWGSEYTLWHEGYFELKTIETHQTQEELLTSPLIAWNNLDKGPIERNLLAERALSSYNVSCQFNY